MADPDVTPISTAYPQSTVKYGDAVFALDNVDGNKALVIESTDSNLLDRFEGKSEGDRFVGPTSDKNAAALREIFEWLRLTGMGTGTSAGFGDRLGLCTPGDVRALLAVDDRINGVFAQQSIREMSRTNRTPTDVVNDAMWGVFQENYQDGLGGDADHLKTTEAIDECAAVGYQLYTFDPGDVMDVEAATAPASEVAQKLSQLDWSALHTSQDEAHAHYVGMTIDLGDESLTLSDEDVARGFAKYGPSMALAMKLHEHLVSKNIPYEIEFAVDETDVPTTPAEHVLVAAELQRVGIPIVSMAPRFVGQFEKGVEYIGDLDALRADFQIQAKIARAMGGYKLSLHSGSDKYSTYPLLAEATDGNMHLKTAGTSWLEALRVIARVDPELFKTILADSKADFEANRKSYHLSCDPAKITDNPSNDQLEDLLDALDSRQVIHVGYGPAITKYGDQIRADLRANQDMLNDVIEAHFIRHLSPLKPWVK